MPKPSLASRISGPAALTWLLIFGVGALVLLPLAFLVLTALSTTSLGKADNTFTLENFRIVYTTSKYLGLFSNTIALASLVTVISVSIGSLLAWMMARTDLPGRTVFEPAMAIPIFISPLLSTLGWMAMASPKAGLINVWVNQQLGLASFNIISFAGIVYVMALFFIPYAFLFLIGAFRNMDATLEEAARTTGAGLGYTTFHITLPLLAPAILSSAVMIFVLSAELFVVPMLIGSQFNFHTVPMAIYESVDYGFSPIGEAAALGTVLFWVTAVGIYYYQRLTRLSRKYVTVSGKGARVRRIDLGWLRWLAFSFVILYLLLAVILPLGTLILGSFMKFLTARINWNVFTLRNYEQLFSTAENSLAIQNTLFLAIAGATLTVLLSALISSVVVRTHVRARGALDYLAALPISVPSVVLALGMLSAYNYLPIPIYGTIWILLIAYMTRFLGHGVRIVSASLVQIDPELEEAGRVTGASPARTFGLITIPLLRSSLSSAWTMLFAFMVIEVSSTLFLYSTGTVTMSVVMWNKIQMSGSISAYPLAVLQCLIVFAVLLIAGRNARQLGTIKS